MYILNTCTRTTTVKCQMRRLPFRSSSIWDLHITNACVHSAFTTHTHVRASIHHTHTHKFSTTSIREVVSFLTPFFIFLTQNKGQMFNTYRPALNSVGKIFLSAVLPSWHLIALLIGFFPIPPNCVAQHVTHMYLVSCISYCAVGIFIMQ